MHPEGKFVVDLDKNIDIKDVTSNSRVALRNDSYTLHKILPNKVDPLVSLMMVEKVPDSTYEMVGGLDKQIKEIKEVIELPVKHPELFEALGIAQPKGLKKTFFFIFLLFFFFFFFFSFEKVYFFMDLLAQGKLYWLELLLIIQIVPSFELAVQS